MSFRRNQTTFLVNLRWSTGSELSFGFVPLLVLYLFIACVWPSITTTLGLILLKPGISSTKSTQILIIE